MTVPQVSLVDAGNALVAQVPTQIHSGSVMTPAGKLGVVTLRTASTTMTVFLSGAELRSWATMLTGLADEVTGGLVTASAADVAAVTQPPVAYRRR